MTEWVDRITDLDERQATLALYEAKVAAGEALAEAMEHAPQIPGLDAKIEALQAEYDRRRNEVARWYDEQRIKLGIEPSWLTQEKLLDLAVEAYEQANPLLVDEDGDVIMCAVSDVPLFEDDITIEIGDGLVLASLFVPQEVFDALLPGPDEDDTPYEEAA